MVLQSYMLTINLEKIKKLFKWLFNKWVMLYFTLLKNLKITNK